MTQAIRQTSEQIRKYILLNVKRPGLAGRVVGKFGISRQAANRHLRTLVSEGAIFATGETKNRLYRLAPTSSTHFGYLIEPRLEEDIVWQRDIRPLVEKLPASVLNIWQWAFTEMFNNAIDHSEGSEIVVAVKSTARHTEIMVSDNGVGIFKKIKERFGLDDERQAIFELAKGKLTTDAKRHSGQGIFFTSRMVDAFDILASGASFHHKVESEEDWLLEQPDRKIGTTVFMRVDNHTSRTTQKILSKYSVGDSYGFNKTVVPVAMVRYGTDQLISRSQAKRVLARVDLFAQVVFDFEGIEEIGQAFADEIFRVFALQHPKVQLLPIHTNKIIRDMIGAAQRSARRK